MKEIIYQDYGRKGSVAATIGIYELSKAIGQDMNLQGRDFKPHTYNNWIRDAMNPSNKISFKQGIRMGKILATGGQWEPSYGKTKGEDLARAIVYTLRNQGAYEWTNVIECVKAMPAPFNELSDVEYEPEQASREILKNGIAKVIGSQTLIEVKEAAVKFVGLVDKLIIEKADDDRDLKKKDFQLLTIANNMKDLSNENQLLKSQLSDQLRKEIEHLTNVLPNIKEEKDQKQIQLTIKNARKRLKKLKVQ